MTLPLAERAAHEPLSYALVTPEAKQHRFVLFIARIVAASSICVALYPLLLASSAFLGPRSGYSVASAFTSYSPYSQTTALTLVFRWMIWINGMAALFTVIGAIGTLMRRNAMRVLLASSLTLYSAGSITEIILRHWQMIGLFVNARAPGQQVIIALSIVTVIAPVMFPIVAAAILWHPAMRELSRAQSDFLPPGAQTLCFIAVVFGAMGLLLRPLALLSVFGPTLTEQAPLGLPFLARTGPSLMVWHGVTRFVLFFCSLTMLIGAVRLMRGNLRGRKLMVRQATVAIIVNVVETVLILVLLVQVPDVLIAVAGALQHLILILPGLALDIAICIYFSDRRTKRIFLPTST